MADAQMETARFNMIEQQIRPWEVLDGRVLETMAALPRERFVPDAFRGLAYADIEIPIGHGQVMMAPRVVGRMLQALAVEPGDTALEIGTGSGYVTACLARLGARVTSIELIPELHELARANLSGLGLRKIDLRLGDALAGPVAGAPFDPIAVTGSLPSREQLDGVRDQLETGGRLFAVVGSEPIMEALLITRVRDREFREETLFETCLPTLSKVQEPEHFVF